MLPARGNVIYTVIRIVAPDFPCGWCITMSTTVCVRVHAAGSGSFSTADGREMPAPTKKALTRDHCDVHKHPVDDTTTTRELYRVSGAGYTEARVKVEHVNLSTRTCGIL